MPKATASLVHGRGGWRAELLTYPPLEEDADALLLFEDGSRLHVPVALLERREDEQYYLDLPLEELLSRAEGKQGEKQVIPVIEEQLSVFNREVESGGVRITKVIREHEEVVDEPLLREDVQVERVPVERYVDGPVEVRYEGDTTIIPVVEEVLVVEKRLLLKEELHVTKKRREVREPETVTLRREEVEIERLEPRGHEGLE